MVSGAHKQGLSLGYLLSLSGLSLSGYYKYLKTKDYKQFKDKQSVELITNIFNTQKHKAGIKTIYMILKNKYGIIINRKKIARIKREYGLITKIRKKNPHNIAYKKDLKHRVASNVLNRDFKVGLPDFAYSADISYLIYKSGRRAYLSVVKDLCTKEIKAFNISPHMGLDLVYNGLEDLLKDKANLVVHSDQGFHYTHPIYVKILKDNEVIQSMSGKGNCLDNAPIESFFGHMKDEIELKACQSFEEVKQTVEKYINYYNNERYQWNLKQMTPKQFRCHLLNTNP